MSTRDNPNNNWIIGVVLGLSASIAINAGNNIQVLGLKKLKELKENKDESRNETNPKKLTLFFTASSAVAPENTLNVVDDDAQHTKPYESKIWILGTVIFVTGTIFNFYSYAFAAQSLLASLESVQFVTNLLFGSCMLGSKVSHQMIIGTLLTVVGTIVAVQFSSKAHIELSLRDMITNYTNPVYIAYLGFTFALLIGLRLLYKFHNRLEKMNVPQKYTSVVLPWSFSIGSALVGTQSVVHAKVLAELFALHAKGGENVFHSWFTYVTAIFWLATAAVWLKQLSDALELFDPMFIIPLLQCSFIFFAILSGGIYFKEFDTFSVQQWLGFWGAISVMFMGLFLVSHRNSSKEHAFVQAVADLLLRNNAFTEQDNVDPERVLPRNLNQISPPFLSAEGNCGDSALADHHAPLANSKTHRQNPATAAVHLETVSMKGSITMEALTVAFRNTAQTAATAAKILLANHTTLLTNAAILSVGKQAEAATKRRELISRAHNLLEQRTRESEGFSQQIMDIVSQIKTDLGLPIEVMEEIGDLIPHKPRTEINLANGCAP